MPDNRGQRDFSPCPFACSCGLDAGSGEDLIEHLSHFAVGGDSAVNDIGRLGVDRSFGAVDLDVAVGLGSLDLGSASSDGVQLGLQLVGEVVGRQALTVFLIDLTGQIHETSQNVELVVLAGLDNDDVGALGVLVASTLNEAVGVVKALVTL